MNTSDILLSIIAVFVFLQWWDASPHSTRLLVKYGKIKYKTIRYFKKCK